MAFDITSFINPPPISIHDCLANREIDIQCYWMYKRKKRWKDEESDISNSVIQMHKNKRKRSNEEQFYPKTKRIRLVKK